MLASFRVKIVLWYTALALLTLLAFRIVSFQVIKKSLHDELDSSLSSEVYWVRDVLIAYKSRHLPDEEIREEIAARSRLSPRKEFIEVYHASGELFFRSSNLEDGEVLRILGKSALQEPISVSSFRGHQMRLFGMRDTSYTVYVGYPLTDIDAAMGEILDSFFYLIPLALVLLAAGGLFLVTRFIKPVGQLNAFAQTVASYPLDGEPPQMLIRSEDEMGKLVRTIEEIVKKMRDSMRQAIGFSALASHELRTPLTIVRNQLESALSTDVAEDALKATIASTYDEILRLGRSVEGLLNLGSMQAGTFTLNLSRTTLRSLLKGFYEEARYLSAGKGIAFTMGRIPDIQIEVDETRFRQVLFNLLDNSIKHTVERGRIQLSAELRDQNAVIHFSDTGAGIPPDKLSHIFDAFYSSSGANGHKSPGSGLGLTLVRWIVQLHKGSIDVASEPGRGTTFSIQLPVSGALAMGS